MGNSAGRRNLAARVWPGERAKGGAGSSRFPTVACKLIHADRHYLGLLSLHFDGVAGGEAWDLEGWLAEFAGEAFTSSPESDQPRLSRKVSFATPEAKLLKIPAEHTPPPLPRPTAKAQLVAAKRMQAELKKKSGKTGENDLDGDCEKVAKTPKTKVGKGKAAKQNSKKKRKAQNGPVQSTFHRFMAAQREAGVKHPKALKLWKVSEERQALISTMSPAERKRRRFD